MRTVFLMMTLILTLGLGVAATQSAEEAAINTRIEGYFAAMAKADMEGYLAFYTENAVRALGTNIVVGRANIAQASTFADGGPQITFTRHATRVCCLRRRPLCVAPTKSPVRQRQLQGTRFSL